MPFTMSAPVAPASLQSGGRGGGSDGAKLAFEAYEGEHQLPEVAAMIEAELSEPYSV